MKPVKWLFATAMLAMLAGGIQPALADYIYDFSFSGGGISGSAQIVTSTALNGMGGFDILTLSGSENGNAMMLLGGQPGAPTYSPSGAFIYDNTWFATGKHLDDWGILFALTGYAGVEGNIFYDGSNYWFYLWSPDCGCYSVATEILFQVPEPVSAALLGTGLLVTGIMFRRRKRAASRHLA